MKPMNDKEFKDKLSKTIANTLNALSGKETPKVKEKSDLALRDSDVTQMVANSLFRYMGGTPEVKTKSNLAEAEEYLEKYWRQNPTELTEVLSGISKAVALIEEE